MCDWGVYRLELTLLGREALNLLLVSRAMARMASWNWTWMYRKRLVWFHEKIHSSFMRECISLLIRDTKGKVPKWEIEAIYQTAARRSPFRAREYALEQAVLRPQLRNRKGANRKVELRAAPAPFDASEVTAEVARAQAPLGRTGAWSKKGSKHREAPPRHTPNVEQPLPAQAAMPKRPRNHFFRNPARRPRTGPIGLDSLPPTLVEQVLSYIYPEGCLDFMQKRQLQRMTKDSPTTTR